jgi:prepilin-type N-terminal cleavage/methylation domain-containing protein
LQLNPLVRRGSQDRAGAKRGGFTLMEIVLVLAVMVLVAGMSWPYFEAWFQSYRLQEGVDIVRTHWIKGRTHAMEEGRPYRFAWIENGGYYRLAPDDVEHWPDMPGVSTSGAGYPVGLVVEGNLPEGVRFLPEGEGVIGQLESGGGGWTETAIVFQADGTASILDGMGVELPEIQVFLADPTKRTYALQLRALTGVVTAVNLGKVGP